MADKYFNNVSMLLHGNGDNNSTVIIDSSKYAHTGTRVGDTKISTDITLINGSAIKFDGVSDFIEYANTDELCLGGGVDWTLEAQIMLVHFSNVPANPRILAKDKNAPDSREFDWTFGGWDGTKYTLIYFFAFLSNGDYRQLTVSHNFLLNQRYSVGVSCTGNVIKMYADNAQIATVTLPANITNSTAPLRVGNTGYADTGISCFCGYIDEIRITKGVARDLTVPQTAQFPDFGYLYPITINEVLAIDKFDVFVYYAETGVLQRKDTVTTANGSLSMNAMTLDDALVTIVVAPSAKKWLANTAYALGDIVYPSNPAANKHYFKRALVGSSGATEPSWSSAIGVKCNDGAVTDAWECISGLVQPTINSFLLPS